MTEQADLKKQVLEFLEQLNVEGETKQTKLLEAITGKSSFEALAKAEYSLLIELLSDLLSKSIEEQKLSLDLLLDARD